MQESQPPNLNFLFRLLVPVSGMFVVTLLAMLATLFSDPSAEASPAHRLLDRYAGVALTVEVFAIVVIAILAMAVDRRETIRHQRSAGNAAATTATASPPDVNDSANAATDSQAFPVIQPATPTSTGS